MPHHEERSFDWLKALKTIWEIVLQLGVERNANSTQISEIARFKMHRRKDKASIDKSERHIFISNSMSLKLYYNYLKLSCNLLIALFKTEINVNDV